MDAHSEIVRSLAFVERHRYAFSSSGYRRRKARAVARITPAELRDRIAAGEQLLIVNLRVGAPTPRRSFPAPFAFHPKSLPAQPGNCARTGDHSLLRLTERGLQRPCGAAVRAQGIKRVRPLQGGANARAELDA